MSDRKETPWRDLYHYTVSHKWVRVLAFGLAVTFTSCLYAGWQQYSLILIQGGKYDWLCEGVLRPSEGGVLSCPAQEKAIGSMFPLASGLELLGAVVAGLALDHSGPRSTAVVGEILGFVAIVMLMLTTAKVNLLPAAMVVTGVAINLVAFPALILEDYFPTAAATTAAFVVACQSLSCAVAPVMWLMWKNFPHWSFNGIWSVYLVVFWIPLGIFYIMCLPTQRELREDQPEQPVEPELTVEPSPPPDLSTVAETPTDMALIPVPSAEARRLGVRDFGRVCVSPQFLVLNGVNMILMLQSAYYQVVVRSESGAQISDFLGWMLPTQAVWGLILGRVVDHIKTPAMIVLLLLGYGATYLLVLAGRSGVQYLTATIFIVVTSYAYTVKYSYIQETFPPSFYGKMVGIAGALSGVSVLLTNVLTNTMNNTFWCLGLSIASLVGIVMSAYLWYDQRAKCPAKAVVDKSDTPLVS